MGEADNLPRNEKKGGSPGIYEILPKHFSNLLKVISGANLRSGTLLTRLNY